MTRMPQLGSTSKDTMLPVVSLAPRTLATSSIFTILLPMVSIRSLRWASHMDPNLTIASSLKA